MAKEHEEELAELEAQKKTSSPQEGSSGHEVEKLRKDLQKKEEMIKLLGESKQNAKEEAR